MVSNSDIQIWRDTVQGINESGITDLTQEEWSALMELNDCLSSGNFQSENSKYYYRLLKNNLSNHCNNPALHNHLQNYIALFEQYAGAEYSRTTTDYTAEPPLETAISSGGSALGGSTMKLILAGAALVGGYLVYDNWDTISGLFGGKSDAKEIVDERNNENNPNQMQPPPIENTTGYANACVLLPQNWDGKSVLINSFVWIWVDDKKLQDKYNIHPGKNYGFEDDHETWDDDGSFYKYPLSPNVVIEAGGWSGSSFKTQKMTVNEFASYLRNLGWGVEGANNFGIVANVTYENNMITKIIEKYTP